MKITCTQPAPSRKDRPQEHVDTPGTLPSALLNSQINLKHIVTDNKSGLIVAPLTTTSILLSCVQKPVCPFAHGYSEKMNWSGLKALTFLQSRYHAITTGPYLLLGVRMPLERFFC
eukprot:4164022-Amphidinium_carterae.1